jgi:predicted outer membrane repeat protein
MTRYFRGLFQGPARPGPARRPRPPRRSRPALEALENRLMPALLTVTDGGDSAFDPQSLRSALLQAQPGDTIDFAPAVRSIGLSDGLEVRTNVRIVNDQGIGPVTIDGGDAVTPFTVDPGVTASLSGLTISHGIAPVAGGGILNQGTLDLTNCALSNNSSGFGGGIENEGTLTLDSCTFFGNSAAFGGGIENGGTLTLSNCTFSGNLAGSDGGGIANDFGGSLKLSNCTLSGNIANSNGGGIENEGMLTLGNCTLSGNIASELGGGIENEGLLALDSCTLSGNSAGFGGGIDNQDTLTLTGCTLSGNLAAEMGGGITNHGAAMLTATLALDNCTLSGNQAGTGGGGIDSGDTLTLTSCTLSGNSAGLFGGGINSSGGTALLHNTIVAGNVNDAVGVQPDDISGTVDPNSSYNLIGTGGSGGLSNDVNNNLVGVSDPGLAELTDNGGPTQTMAVLSTSPALGAGDPALGGTTDQRGIVRMGLVNIGAYQDPAIGPGSGASGPFTGYPPWNPWNPDNPGPPHVGRMM